MSRTNARQDAMRKRLASAAKPRARVAAVELILQAATRAFPQLGYEGTSMDVVAQLAGVARRTLYNNFRSKEDLFIQTVERLWATFPRPEMMMHHDDPVAGLTRLGVGFASFPEPTMAFLRLVIAEGPRFPELTRAFEEGGRHSARTTLKQYLALLAEHGHVSVGDPDLATEQFLGMIAGPLLWTPLMTGKDVPPAAERTFVVESAVRMFLARYGR